MWSVKGFSGAARRALNPDMIQGAPANARRGVGRAPAREYPADGERRNMCHKAIGVAMGKVDGTATIMRQMGLVLSEEERAALQRMRRRERVETLAVVVAIVLAGAVALVATQT